MSEVLKVSIREQTGKRRIRRLRQSGVVPAVLYGHGEKTVSLSLNADEVAAVVRHGSRVIDLQGDVQEKAIIREMQWDAFGGEILHLDLNRVYADEKVTVEVTVELRGEAPGVREGGMVQHLVHEVEIECPVESVPEKLVLHINHLSVDQELTAADVELPAGATLLSDPETVMVQCIVPTEQDEESLATDGAEPELIRREAKDDEEE